jgi:hypothetical protein
LEFSKRQLLKAKHLLRVAVGLDGQALAWGVFMCMLWHPAWQLQAEVQSSPGLHCAPTAVETNYSYDNNSGTKVRECMEVVPVQQGLILIAYTHYWLLTAKHISLIFNICFQH